MAGAMVLTGQFEDLFSLFIFAQWIFYALAVASIFLLRRRPGYAPSFRVPGYPVVPALFVLSVLFLLGNAIAEPGSRMSTLGVLGVGAAGAPVYYLVLRRRVTG